MCVAIRKLNSDSDVTQSPFLFFLPFLSNSLLPSIQTKGRDDIARSFRFQRQGSQLRILIELLAVSVTHCHTTHALKTFQCPTIIYIVLNTACS